MTDIVERLRGKWIAVDIAGRFLMTWKPRKPKWPWRTYLTGEERAVLKRADEAKAVWLNLNRERAAITNRAIQRAKYAAPPAVKRLRSILAREVL